MSQVWSSSNPPTIESVSPTVIICIDPASINDIPTARNVNPNLIGLRTLDLIESPSIVGIHPVRRFSKLDPTRISDCPPKISSGSILVAFQAGNAPEKKTSNITNPI